MKVINKQSKINFFDTLNRHRTEIENNILVTANNSKSLYYKFDDMISALEFMIDIGINGKTFYLGNDHKIGLVNLASFLAQCMKETIQYDACDENNWSSDATYGWLGNWNEIKNRP